MTATVLITGASSGIGLQLAQDYLAKGWQVVACGRDAGKLEALTQHTLAGVHICVFDVTARSDVRHASQKVNALLQQLNAQLDLVILNAGSCEYIDDAKEFDDQLFERVVHTNLIAMGYCIGAFLPLMPAHSRLGLMSSSAVYVPFPRAEAYGASKAGVQYLAASLAIDLLKHDIGVSVICPGFVNTPLTQKNDFPMPMQIKVQAASYAIRQGLAAGKHEIHFPKSFTYILKFMALLPSTLWLRLMASRDNPSVKDAQ